MYIALLSRMSCFSSSELPFSQEFGLTHILKYGKICYEHFTLVNSFKPHNIPREGITIFTSILKMGKLRHREIVPFDQRHTA